MSMSIMWKRYGEVKMTPAGCVGFNSYLTAERFVCQKSPKNFSGDEPIEKFIIPLVWDNRLKIYGMVAPFNMPIYGNSTSSFSEVKKAFLKEWKAIWGGELFWKSLWIVEETVKKSKSPEVQSYVQWRNSDRKQELAFIYLGNFWMYKDETETLNQAAKRFFDEHRNDKLLKKSFACECRKKRWNDNSSKYVNALFNDEALLFTHSGKALAKIHCYSADPSAAMWKSLCVLGYFPWVKSLNFSTYLDLNKTLS